MGDAARAAQERLSRYRPFRQRHRAERADARPEYIRSLKSGGCTACHQLGNKATREIPKVLGTFPSTAAWERRVQSGQAGGQMLGGITNLGKDRTLGVFADWTDRIAKGEIPPTPASPAGTRTQCRHHAVGLGRSDRVSP